MHLLDGETLILLCPLKFSVYLLEQYFMAIGIFFLPKLCYDLLGWWHMWLQKLKEGSPENSRRKFPMFVKAGRQDGL